MRTKVAIVAVVLFGWACSQTPSQSGAQTGQAVQQEPLVISAQEAYKRWKSNPDKVVILDVRTPQEYQSGHVKGAQNIDFYNNFEQAIQKLPKDKEYYLHCASGRRSGSAAEIMRKYGFKAYNMGGYGAVSQAGFPTE
ncbi:MAG: rhodanese-like domain-containing protein [Bacteroidia bacterium]|nr:rhodanese-like domain-containing protein [Bacteroidia bacterium]MCX7763416.1 rhodanese-like domain-containing protein [Bacteroidia bacterium]MDW8057581.1 rhodanese-like domain-containing protein [Bacteroidia bacterium]